MASVSILYLDWNLIYFITKACLNLYWQPRIGAGQSGAVAQGPLRQPIAQPQAPAAPASSRPLTGGLEGGGCYALQWSDSRHWTIDRNATKLAVEFRGPCIIFLDYVYLALDHHSLSHDVRDHV